MEIIPQALPASEKKQDTDFSRDRKLPLQKIIAFILHLAASGKPGGVDIQAGLFFKAAQRAGLWPQDAIPTRSAISKRRSKVDWTVFQSMLGRAVKLAYQLWPQVPDHLFKGMHVLAIDGSKYTLPASQSLRQHFDPQSGLEQSGKGHYPQCQVHTLFDALRRLPVARIVTGCDGSERDAALELVRQAPKNSLVIFDRGYPGYGFQLALMRDLGVHFLIRCPATSTFPAVMKFVRSGLKEQIIRISPSNKHYAKTPRKQWAELPDLTVRAIRMTAPDGAVSVLITDLTDSQAIGAEELVSLYFRRWTVETQYRDEKQEMQIERFHGKTPNSILQELYAVAIVTVIARLLSTLVDHATPSRQGECQLKNACVTVAHNMACLASRNGVMAAQVLDDILALIARVRYYRPSRARPSQPRITKRPINKWITNRGQIAKRC